MLVEFKMPLSEAAKLLKPVRGRGGFQTLLRLIQARASISFSLSGPDAERFMRYRERYGDGGFQGRMVSRG